MAQLHFGVLPISPDEAGNYSFELDVTDPQGNVGKATATVRSNPPTTGLQNVPIGIRQFLMGDGGTQTHLELEPGRSPARRAQLPSSRAPPRSSPASSPMSWAATP